MEKYENVIKKVEQKEELTDIEALDIAFVSKFLPKEDSSQIIDSLTTAYKDAIIKDELLKLDVGIILGAMIEKHIENEKTQNRLLERIGMRHIEKEIDKLVYDEYGDKLDAKDKEIEEKIKELKEKDKEIKTKDKEINELNQYKNESKNKIKELSKMDDLNPKAKQIIQTMMLL